MNICTASDPGMWSLQWRHNGRDGISNHQPHHYLFNRLFRHSSKKTSKLRGTCLCAENSPMTGESPAQMASNAKDVSIWWRDPDLCVWYAEMLYKWLTWSVFAWEMNITLKTIKHFSVFDYIITHIGYHIEYMPIVYILSVMELMDTGLCLWISLNYKFQRVSYQGAVGANESTLLRLLLVFILQDIDWYVNSVNWPILRILLPGCWCPGALWCQIINSHGFQYGNVFGHFRLAKFQLYWRIRVLDFVQCPSILPIIRLTRPPKRRSFVYVLRIGWGQNGDYDVINIVQLAQIVCYVVHCKENNLHLKLWTFEISFS